MALLVTSARQLCGLAADTEARTLAAGVTRAALAAAVAGEDGSAGKTRPAQQDQLEVRAGVVSFDRAGLGGRPHPVDSCSHRGLQASHCKRQSNP